MTTQRRNVLKPLSRAWTIIGHLADSIDQAIDSGAWDIKGIPLNGLSGSDTVNVNTVSSSIMKSVMKSNAKSSTINMNINTKTEDKDDEYVNLNQKGNESGKEKEEVEDNSYNSSSSSSSSSSSLKLASLPRVVARECYADFLSVLDYDGPLNTVTTWLALPFLAVFLTKRRAGKSRG